MMQSSQVHRARVSPQRAFATQVEVDIEIAHGKFAQAAVHRLPITAAGEIGLCHSAPMPALLENGNDMIGVLFRFQIEDQWWKTENAKRCGTKNSAFQTGRRVIVQNFLRRSRSEA